MLRKISHQRTSFSHTPNITDLLLHRAEKNSDSHAKL